MAIPRKPARAPASAETTASLQVLMLRRPLTPKQAERVRKCAPDEITTASEMPRVTGRS